jgi:hypothetical protein
MAKLKLRTFDNQRPVKVTLELPASVHRDLTIYAGVFAQENGQEPIEPAKLIAPILAQFMATDRAFAKSRRTAIQTREKKPPPQ